MTVTQIKLHIGNAPQLNHLCTIQEIPTVFSDGFTPAVTERLNQGHRTALDGDIRVNWLGYP